MSGRPGAFHTKKHGQHVRLLEEDTVAHRIDSYNKAVVFTDQPIPQGSMFQVKLLDKGGGWAGSIVSVQSYYVFFPWSVWKKKHGVCVCGNQPVCVSTRSPARCVLLMCTKC